MTSPEVDEAGVAVDTGLVGVSPLSFDAGVVTTGVAGLVAAAALVGDTAAVPVEVVGLEVPGVNEALALDVGLAADAPPALSLLLAPPPPPPPHAASMTLIASVAADIADPRTRGKRKREERRSSKFVM
ncbi:hypothetical protein [Caballeronia sp. LZ065]|uniref:hypothetical protein n=1 Tax=Caballeronia sp. LZ065 TaxID=3038571 RepID=UPI00286B42FB|nr:hypothetical protein [Caballeronia sp. LZ065]